MLKTKDLSSAMIKAVRKNLGKRWNNNYKYLEKEIKEIAAVINDILTGYLNGRYHKEKSKLMYKVRRMITLLLILEKEGVGNRRILKAFSAATGAIKEQVNEALGWNMIGVR